MSLSNKKIIVGITGGIAAYKSIELIRLLRKAGAQVQVVMTASALEFVTPLTVSAIAGNPVRTELFDVAAEQSMSHIELARWADLFIIAPASANTIAHLAQGLAKDLLTTLVLATEAPVVFAPAMNRVMWEQTITQENVAKLTTRDFQCLGPEYGEQACGDVGQGRMLEPEIMLQQVESLFAEQTLQGKTVLITAGPTHEAVDPVRYLTNFSTGTQGYALARAAHARGARVILVSGPTQLQPPSGVKVIQVISAVEMDVAVQSVLADVDIFIGTAAVADYRVPEINSQKIKKSRDHLTLELVPNPDIIANVANAKNRPVLVVGFAAETNNIEEYALKKLQDKKLDAIVANQVGFNQGFGKVENALSVYFKDGRVEKIPAAVKEVLAETLITVCEKQILALG